VDYYKYHNWYLYVMMIVNAIFVIMGKKYNNLDEYNLDDVYELYQFY
jgi:hypothetical protein